jgi:hypothetical protein
MSPGILIFGLEPGPYKTGGHPKWDKAEITGCFGPPESESDQLINNRKGKE